MSKRAMHLLIACVILEFINAVFSSEAEFKLNGTEIAQLSTDYDYEYYDEVTNAIENFDSLVTHTNLLPYIEQSEKKIVAATNTNLIMYCDIKNIQSNNVVIWYKDNTMYANGQYVINQRVTYLSNHSILLKNININDAGNYYCVILPENIRQHIILEVTTPTLASASTPGSASASESHLTILCDGDDVLNQHVIYKANESHVCECKSSSSSSTSTVHQMMKWLINGQRAEEFFKVQQHILWLNNIDVHHTGLYECLDDSDSDSVNNLKRASFNISIYYRPKLTALRHYINTDLTLNAKLYCDYASQPTATVAWIRDTELLSYSEKYMINFLQDRQFNRTTLTINNIQLTDLGEYTCLAENTLGVSELRIHLILQPEPGEFQTIEIYGNRIIIDWLVRSYQPLLDTIFEYKLNGFNPISVKHKQHHHNGMWKVTHDIMLPNGEWQTRMQTKNLNGWSLFSQSYNFTINYDDNNLQSAMASSDLEHVRMLAEIHNENLTLATLNRTSTLKVNYWYNFCNFYIFILLFLIHRLI